MDEARQRSVAPTKGIRIALWVLCLAACVLFVFGAIGFFFGPAFTNTFNSDAAVAVLLAKEVLHAGRPVPSTWYFANDEIWALAPHVFVLPFVAALGISTLALKLGNLLCVIVIAVFVALPLHRVTRSWPYSILVAAGVVAAFSPFQEQVLYSQTAYGWFTAQFALLVYLALRMLDESGPEPPGASGRIFFGASALYALFVINLAIDSPLRAAVYWALPLVGVTVLFSRSKPGWRVLVAVTIVALLAGTALHDVISGYVLTQAGTTARLLNRVGAWTHSLETVSRGLPMLIGYGNAPAGWVRTLGIARVGLFGLAAVVVLIAPAGNGPGSVECRFFARVAGAMLLVVLGVLMVGTLAVDASAARYLIAPALLCLAAFMAIVWCRLRASAYGIALAVLFVAAFCGGGMLLVAPRAGTLAFDRDCDAPAAICRLKTALEKTGIHHGYATYWRANVTTVASRGAITLCAVRLSPRLEPVRWLVSKACFDTPAEESFFLALEQGEIAKVGRDVLIREAGTPDRILTDAGYEIWIYATARANLDWLKR